MSSSTSQFVVGMTARFLLSCVSWTSLRLAHATLFASPRQPLKYSIRKAFIKNMSYCKIWLTSFLLETSVSCLSVPGPFIVGKHVTRVMLDSFMPIVSDFLFKLDNFSHAGFLSFASKNLIRIYSASSNNNNSSSSSGSGGYSYSNSNDPSSPLSFNQSATAPVASPRGVAKDRNSNLLASSTPMMTDPIAGATSFEHAGGDGRSVSTTVTSSFGGGGGHHHIQNTSTGTGGVASISNAFVYQLPTTILHLVKLVIRAQRLGMKRTRFFRCIGVALLQYAVRVPLMSFATMLPMSDSELAFCSICMVIDKCSDSYLYYHTWPWPDYTSVSSTTTTTESSSSSVGGAEEEQQDK